MREISDEFEVELKFRSVGGMSGDQVTVARCQQILAPGLEIVPSAPRALLDFYLDDDDRSFCQHGASLRLRRLNRPYRERKGYSLNFKPPAPTGPILERREVRTRLLDSELTGVPVSQLPGKSMYYAQQWLTSSDVVGDINTLAPRVIVYSFRREYYVREEGTEKYAAFLVFDSCQAKRLSRVDPLDGVDGRKWSMAAFGEAIFESAELELAAREAKVSSYAREVFGALVGCLAPDGRSAEVGTKYQEANSLLMSTGIGIENERSVKDRGRFESIVSDREVYRSDQEM